MEAKQMNILDLNNDCLGEILKYLSGEEHLRFAETCDRFREVFREWFNVLYPEYEFAIFNDSDDSDSSENVIQRRIVEWQLKILIIGADLIKRLFVIGENLTAFDSIPRLCNLLPKMVNLQYIAVSENDQECPVKMRRFYNHPFDKVLPALEDLPKLKCISLNRSSNDYRMDTFTRIKCLEGIALDNDIMSHDLLLICLSNKKLRVLWLKGITGRIENVVPHMANLEQFAFEMLDKCQSFVSIAELPKLRKVIIRQTTRGTENLKELIDAFAAKGEDSKLESLTLYSEITFKETSKIIQLVQLKELTCAFENVKCIDLLTNLTELEFLDITLIPSETGADECLNVLKSCRKLQRLYLISKINLDFAKKAMEVLRTVRNPKTQKPLEFYSSGLNRFYKVDKKKLFDKNYCILLDEMDNLGVMYWKLPHDLNS